MPFCIPGDNEIPTLYFDPSESRESIDADFARRTTASLVRNRLERKDFLVLAARSADCADFDLRIAIVLKIGFGGLVVDGIGHSIGDQQARADKNYLVPI